MSFCQNKGRIWGSYTFIQRVAPVSVEHFGVCAGEHGVYGVCVGAYGVCGVCNLAYGAFGGKCGGIWGMWGCVYNHMGYVVVHARAHGVGKDMLQV